MDRIRQWLTLVLLFFDALHPAVKIILLVLLTMNLFFAWITLPTLF
jgi:hypothetical protein